MNEFSINFEIFINYLMYYLETIITRLIEVFERQFPKSLCMLLINLIFATNYRN